MVRDPGVVRRLLERRRPELDAPRDVRVGLGQLRRRAQRRRGVVQNSPEPPDVPQELLRRRRALGAAELAPVALRLERGVVQVVDHRLERVERGALDDAEHHIRRRRGYGARADAHEVRARAGQTLRGSRVRRERQDARRGRRFRNLGVAVVHLAQRRARAAARLVREDELLGAVRLEEGRDRGLEVEELLHRRHGGHVERRGELRASARRGKRRDARGGAWVSGGRRLRGRARKIWDSTRKRGRGRAARARGAEGSSGVGASLERTLSAMNCSLSSPSAMVTVRAPPALYPDALRLGRYRDAEKVVAWTPQSLRIAFFP